MAAEAQTQDIAAAYRCCTRITQLRARNFAYGIRLLPADKRRALCAVYALARQVDDIGDGDLPSGEKLRRLAELSHRLEHLAAGTGRHHGAPGRGDNRESPGTCCESAPGVPQLRENDAPFIALADAVQHFPIPLSAFDELIAGVEADVRGASYETFEELHLYCRNVAGSIGRLSLGVFGSSDPDAAPALADALGVALQLTNILRDVREDTALGRTYLPLEDLQRFNCGVRMEGSHDNVIALLHFEAMRAQEWFDEGGKLLDLLDRRSFACVATMAGIYRGLLERIIADPCVVLEGRVSLPAHEKIAVAAQGLAGRAPWRHARGRRVLAGAPTPRQQ